jgi:uncharacterized protein
MTAIQFPLDARRRISRGWLALLAVLAIAAMPVLAHAQVNDNAKLFSDQAKVDAEKSIQQMRDKYKHTLLIETYPSIPADKKAQYDETKKGPFFEAWAAERGKALNVNGVVFLICMDPKHFQMVVGNETRQKGLFTNSDVSAMQTPIRTAMSQGKYDEVLTTVAASVLQRMDNNAPNVQKKAAAANTPAGRPAPGAPAPTNRPDSGGGINWLWSLLCVGGAILAIVFIIRGIMRARQMSTGGGYGPGPYGQGGYGTGYGPQGGYGYGGGGGSGGFGRGLMGGLLGGVAGSWIGSKIFGQEHQNYPTNYPPAGGGGDAGAPPSDPYGGQDTSYSGGGSDFGDSGGGGGGSDFGSGGDSGGGDFGGGGGDFGGGGGDSGGGGGDF